MGPVTAQGQGVQCPACPPGLHYYLTELMGSVGQGCSASSRSSRLNCFLEACLGRNHRRQAGRHWSSTLCRGQGNGVEGQLDLGPPHPSLASIRVGPTSSMKAPTKLKATRPSSSNLKELSAMFLSPSGPCRRPGTRMRPTRTEPKSARATRKGTGGGGVCQQWRCALGRMHTCTHNHTQMHTLLRVPSATPQPNTPTPPRGSTVGVERLAEGCPLRHGCSQDEVLEAR